MKKTKSEKEKKLLIKVKSKINNNKKKYLTKSQMNKKIKNSQSFINVDCVSEKGIIKLKSGEVAQLLSVQAIDLSLSSQEQKNYFYSQLKYLYQIKDLDLRIYKLNEQLNLNSNKDYILKLMDECKDNEQRLLFLQERYGLLEQLENNEFTVSNCYFLVVIAKNENALKKQVEEIIRICYSLVPRLQLEELTNKYEIYKFLINLYFSSANLEQLLWCELTELITPLNISEKANLLKLENDEVQLLSIKSIPPFLDEGFFEQIFNMPGVRCCIHVKDTVDPDILIKNLDNSYQFLLSDRITTKKLSDATELDTQKENFQILMDQLKNGAEKIKEVNFIVAVNAEKKKREDIIKELKRLAEYYKIRLDVPRLRQYETWQSFDISSSSISDYSVYLPTLTLSASFPLTSTSFNDEHGIMMGLDIHTALPVYFDMFKLTSNRTSHNISLVGSTGSGKSFTLKKLITNAINQIGAKVFIFDCENEYKKLVERNHGEYIDLYSKSGGIINPLQIRFLPVDNGENEDDVANCPLAKHLGFLEAFYKCAFEEISEKELVILLEETEKLYSQFGITKNSTISMIENMKPNEFPLFSDLKQLIVEEKEVIKNSEKLKIIEQLDILLERFLVGTDAFLFDDYTNLNLEKSDLICFNLQELLFSENKRLINTQVLNVLTFLNNAIVKNKILNENVKDKKHIIVVVDEFHLFIDEENPELLKNFGQMARRLRKYSSSFVCATQSIRDFIGSANILRHATAIFNNCQYQLIGMLKEDDLSAYIELFKQNALTDTQKEFLLRAKQGEFLLNITNKKRVRLWVRATQLEQQLMGED